MASRKPAFPKEPITKPATRRKATSGEVSTEAKKKAASEAPTIPPPAMSAGPSSAKGPPKTSGMRPRKGSASATVDTVVADLTHDPRAEADDDD